MAETKDALRRLFISRVRDHLHLVLAFSPVGEAFRSRCRQFLADQLYDHRLVRHLAEDALKAVAEQVFEVAAADERLGQGMQESPETRQQLCELASFVHKSVREMAERFFEEQRRRSYVTPRSFSSCWHCIPPCHLRSVWR